VSSLIADEPSGMQCGPMDNTPRLGTKLIFWLLLGVLSVAVAEVSVASAPFAFVNPFETAFLVTFYGSHLLLFAWFTFRRGWPSLAALWFAGVLFGLYEFYITKVLWSPPWGDVISMGHVDVVSLIVLAFFWHPFMAFIFPLALGEAAGTNRRWVTDQLPSKLTGLSHRRAMFLLAGAAITHGLLTGSPAVAFISTLSALAAVTAVGWWWRRDARQQRWQIRELLPNDRQGRWIVSLLAIQYLVFIPAWTPEKMPPLAGHVVVWLMYAGFGLLLSSALRQSKPELPDQQDTGLDQRALRRGAAALVALSVLGSFGPPEIGFIPVWGVAIVIGLRMLVGSVRHALHAPAPNSVRQNSQGARSAGTR
jgi:hypothetical protein